MSFDGLLAFLLVLGGNLKCSGKGENAQYQLGQRLGASTMCSAIWNALSCAYQEYISLCVGISHVSFDDNSRTKMEKQAMDM